LWNGLSGSSARGPRTSKMNSISIISFSSFLGSLAPYIVMKNMYVINKTFCQKGDNLEETREIIELLLLKATIDILELISKGKTQYKDLIMPIDISISTLNIRLKQLLHSKFITHHIIRDPERNEYYEITEEGKKVLKAFLDFENVLSKI